MELLLLPVRVWEEYVGRYCRQLGLYCRQPENFESMLLKMRRTVAMCAHKDNLPFNPLLVRKTFTMLYPIKHVGIFLALKALSLKEPIKAITNRVTSLLNQVLLYQKSFTLS